MTTVRRRLRLLPPDPPINIAEDADPSTGEVRYRVRGPRATGTVIITPEPGIEAAAIPQSVRVQFGEHAWRDHERPDRLTVNGITLVGGVILTPGEYLTRERRYSLWLRRSAGPYTGPRAPEATDRYGSAIVHALLTTWYARPDRDQLIRAAAGRAAAGRLAALYRDKIRPREAEIERLQTELLDHLRHAGELYQLAREHEASQASQL